jgi:hypothetical protein
MNLNGIQIAVMKYTLMIEIVKLSDPCIRINRFWKCAALDTDQIKL